MNRKLSKKIVNEMQIIASLESIKECTEVARGYINNEYKVNDVEELVVALSAAKEDIEEIESLLFEITCDYEKEIMELKYERL